jgi:flagellar biosynthesis GTPase FlhF
MKHNGMQLYTYRARSLAEAMKIVRAELGPDASVLHTRVIGSPLLGLIGGQTLEVTASDDADVPSRLPEMADTRQSLIPAADLSDYRRQIRLNLRSSVASEISIVEQLSTKT